MTDSTYANQEKSQWKIMLQRRLSSKLQEALVMANDVPKDYHSFVSYLRQKDAAFQEISASTSTPNTTRPFTTQYHQTPTNSPQALHEPTVSQGGSAMDLDLVSQQKGPDGRLTPQAKDARRALGRCVWCNKPGHFAQNCPLGSRTVTTISNLESSKSNDQLKD